MMTHAGRAKLADPLWLLHSDLNKLIAACAFEIVEGVDPEARKRQLYADIQAVSAKYLLETYSSWR